MRIPVARCTFVLGVLIAVAAPPAKADYTTYDYLGNPFTNVSSPYTTSDSLSGYLTFNGPLAAGLLYTGTTNIASDVYTFSFSDGQYTWNTTDSVVSSVYAGTDSHGVIDAWDISLSGNAGPISNGFLLTAGTAGETGGVQDDEVNPAPSVFGYNSGDPGRWQLAGPVGIVGGLVSAPAPLPGGQPVVGVTGEIGGFESQDYYSFLWGGGAFSATASITDAPDADASYLFSEGVAGTCDSGGTATLDSSDSFTNTIGIANLSPGQYCIGIDANSANDPAFALIFNTPVDGVTATPEPSYLVLLSVGLGMIGVLRPTRRSR